MFEAIHGSAPDIAGLGIANPIALALASAMMLEHVGMLDTASRLRSAIARMLAEGKTLTPDLGGRATTFQMASVIKQYVGS